MAISKRIDAPIDRCDATAEWTVLNADVTTLATSTNCLGGSASVSFAKTDGAANSTVAGIYNDNISTAILKDVSPQDELAWYIYVSSKADIAYAFLRIGTDATNYIEYRYDDSDLEAATWNRCHKPIWRPSDLQGTFCDWAAVTYLAVGVVMDAQDDALAGILCGQICHVPSPIIGTTVNVGGSTVEAEIARANAADPSHGENDIVGLSTDLDGYARTRSKAFVPSSRAQAVTAVSATPARTFGPITETTLTAAATQTPWRAIKGLSSATFQLTTANIDDGDDAVTVQVEGSNDGSSAFALAPEDNTVSGITYSGAVATISAADTFGIELKGLSCTHIRLNWLTEGDGETDATIAAVFFAQEV